MVALFFFWVGVSAGFVFLIGLRLKNVKPVVLAFPFWMLLAAAVAKYIGM